MGKLRNILTLPANPKPLYILSVCWSVVCCVLFFTIISQHNNTLSANGNWTCLQLENPNRHEYALQIMGTRLALAGNCFTPGGPDHTAQFLTTAKQYPAKRVKTKLRLTPKSWGGIIFNKTKNTLSGVLLSTHPLRPSMFFEIDEKMLFTRTKPFFHPPLPVNKFFTLEAVLGPQKTKILLNGQLLSQWQYTSPLLKTTGLVSGTQKCSFDDYEIFTAHSNTAVFKETFSNTRHAALIIAALFILCLLVSLTAAQIALKTKNKAICERLFELGMLVVLLAFATTATLRFSGISIFTWKNQRNMFAFGQAKKQLEQGLKQSPAAYKIYQQSPSPSLRLPPAKTNAPTVVLIGDSQAWGDGLKNLQNSYEKVAQLLLKTKMNIDVNCVNLANKGYTTTQLLQDYAKYINHLQPKVCIISCGYTDFRKPGKENLKTILERFIALNRKYKTKTVFLFQPTNPEANFDELKMYQYNHVVKTAFKHNIPVWNIDAYMPKLNNKGFLWYDYVHLTQAGHRFAGAFTAHKLAELLQGKKTCDFKEKNYE